MEKHKNLQSYNTFGINVVAENFATFDTVESLQELLKSPVYTSAKKDSILILGGGSNILFTKNVEGLVLYNQIKGMQVIHEDEHHAFVKVGAGEHWHDFVLFCLTHSLAGAENLALIPGSVGASPMQNIGAYGAEIKDIFYSLEAVDRDTYSIVTFSNNDCAFGYRESVFKNKYKNQFIITNVVYKMNKKPTFNVEYGAIKQELSKMGVQELSINAIAQAVINIRTQKLPNPAEIGNAGSFFKNPEISSEQFSTLKKEFSNIVGYDLRNGNVKLAAGWLIEACGWKGYRKADAGCHALQALVLVNYGHATGLEIQHLSEEIIASVLAKFSVKLEREVNIF